MKENNFKIGIDKISFYVPKFYLNLSTLAKERNIPYEKYSIGIGQEKMSMLPPNEDIVTMAAQAAYNILTDEDKKNIDLLIFCTESAIDQSKAAGIYVHNLLNLNKNSRVVELKEACYSSTIGLRFAINYVSCNPLKSVLLIASDNARYGIGTAGEPTQGCGAIAMVIKKDPKIMSFDNFSGYCTDDVMDFWRPNCRDEAIVDGKYSLKIYLSSMIIAWQNYKTTSSRNFDDHYVICYHSPFTKMVEKAHNHLCDFESKKKENFFEKITTYNRIVGNCYTGSLYLSLISTLDNLENLDNKRIGIFAYGSGCVAEFFSGLVEAGYEQHLISNKAIYNREEIDYQTYIKFYEARNKIEGIFDFNEINSKFIFCGIEDNKRIYKF